MFKWLAGAVLTAVTLVFGLGAALLWKSTSDVQNQATAAIKATQDTATREIATIAKAAQETAKSEAKKAIDVALEKPNLQRLIQDTARERVSAAVEAELQKNLGTKIEAFRTLTTKIGEVSNHGAQLRLGFRSGLDALLKELQDPDPTVRAYARSTLTEVAADYERVIINRIPPGTPGAPPTYIGQFIPDPYTPKTPQKLLATIRTIQGPHELTAAFLDMKKLLAWDVPNFDITAAEKWCTQHKPKCDE